MSFIVSGSYQVLHGFLLLIQGEHSDPIKLLIKHLPQIVSQFPLPLFIAGYALISIVFGLILTLTPSIINYLGVRSLIRPNAWFKVVVEFLAGFCVAVPLVFFKFSIGLMIWLRSTLLNTAHGSDDISITVYSWIEYIFSSYAPVPTSLLFILFFAFIIIFMLTLNFPVKSMKNLMLCRDSIGTLVCQSYPLILLLASVFSLVPIFLSVDRLWGHYLHLGTVFLAIAVFLGCEKLITSKIQTFLPRSWVVSLVAATISMQAVITIFYMMPAMTAEMNMLAQRTATPEFKQKKEEYDYLLNFLQTKVSSQTEPLAVYVGASLFIPESTKDWEVRETFGYFQDWQAEPDVVVMYRKNSPLSHPPLSTSAAYEPWLAAQSAMLKHVSVPNRACSLEPCYYEMDSPQVELLILMKNQ
jgi:hypothetical protein